MSATTEGSRFKNSEKIELAFHGQRLWRRMAKRIGRLGKEINSKCSNSSDLEEERVMLYFIETRI